MAETELRVKGAGRHIGRAYEEPHNGAQGMTKGRLHEQSSETLSGRARINGNEVYTRPRPERTIPQDKEASDLAAVPRSQDCHAGIGCGGFHMRRRQAVGITWKKL